MAVLWHLIVNKIQFFINCKFRFFWHTALLATQLGCQNRYQSPAVLIWVSVVMAP